LGNSFWQWLLDLPPINSSDFYLIAKAPFIQIGAENRKGSGLAGNTPSANRLDRESRGVAGDCTRNYGRRVAGDIGVDSSGVAGDCTRITESCNAGFVDSGLSPDPDINPRLGGSGMRRRRKEVREVCQAREKPPAS